MKNLILILIPFAFLSCNKNNETKNSNEANIYIVKSQLKQTIKTTEKLLENLTLNDTLERAFKKKEQIFNLCFEIEKILNEKGGFNPSIGTYKNGQNNIGDLLAKSVQTGSKTMCNGKGNDLVFYIQQYEKILNSEQKILPLEPFSDPKFIDRKDDKNKCLGSILFENKKVTEALITLYSIQNTVLSHEHNFLNDSQKI